MTIEKKEDRNKSKKEATSSSKIINNDDNSNKDEINKFIDEKIDLGNGDDAEQTEDKESDKIEKSEPKDSKKQTIFVIGFILAIILIMFALFLIPKFFVDDKRPLTESERNQLIADLHRQNLAGELLPEEGMIYNGYSLVYYDEFSVWNLQIFSTLYQAPIQLFMHFNPEEVVDVEVNNLDQLDTYYEKTLDANNNISEEIKSNENLSMFSYVDGFISQSYLVFDPGAFNGQSVGTVMGELTTNLGQSISLGLVPGCTESDQADCDSFGIIKNCENTNNPVIYLRNDPEQVSIDINDSCVTISGSNLPPNRDLTKAVDKFIYLSLGIIEE